MEEEEEQKIATEYCSNCKKDIPSVNYVMHASHCSRNITLCDLCKEPVPISEKDEHFDEYHAKVKCDCGEYFEKMDLDDHKENDCSNRKVACEYCELELPYQEMKAHKDFCGSRTELCDKCSKYVQHKDLESHLNSNCQAEIPAVQNNAGSTNVLFGRPNRIPPDELIQNVDFDSVDDLGVDALQRLLLTTQGMLQDNRYDMIEQSRLFDTQNMFPPPNRDVVARGASFQPSRTRRDNRHSTEIDDSMYNEDTLARKQLEGDELMAALLACDEDHPTLTNQWSSLNSHNSFDHEAENRDENYESALDQTVLPCEFCGEAIQAQDLILHQTGCQLTSMGATSTVRYPNLRSQPRSLSPIQYESLNDEVERDNQEYNQNHTLLPCEFCFELIRSDLLFTHQSCCDLQRPRPSSVSQAEYFYENEPEPPLSNGARPKASNRPPRPSRPVVENRTFENLLKSESKAPKTLTSGRNDNSFSIPRNNINEPRRQSPSQSNRDNRGMYGMRAMLNGSPLSTTSKYSTTNHRHSLPDMASKDNNDKFKVVLPRNGSAEKLVYRKDAGKLEQTSFNSKTPFESTRSRNGRLKVDSEPDLLNDEVERDNQEYNQNHTLLPCEFCFELIRSDLLFTHQSCCDLQRPRPSSVSQAEYFYESEPEPPLSIRNGRLKVDSEPDLGITGRTPKVLQETSSKYNSSRLETSGVRPLNDKKQTSKTSSTKKKSSTAKVSEPLQHTKESRKQSYPLAPSFDRRHQGERSQQKANPGPSETSQRQNRSTEERNTSGTRPRRSKKKFA